MSKGRGNSSKIDENSITAWRRKKMEIYVEKTPREIFLNEIIDLGCY
jgi:hypothetical protein